MRSAIAPDYTTVARITVANKNLCANWKRRDCQNNMTTNKAYTNKMADRSEIGMTSWSNRLWERACTHTRTSRAQTHKLTSTFNCWLLSKSANQLGPHSATGKTSMFRFLHRKQVAAQKYLSLIRRTTCLRTNRIVAYCPEEVASRGHRRWCGGLLTWKQKGRWRYWVLFSCLEDDFTKKLQRSSKTLLKQEMSVICHQSGVDQYWLHIYLYSKSFCTILKICAKNIRT